jgi:hypothetical protein
MLRALRHPPIWALVAAQVGYASSWSAYSIYRKQHPDKPDPLVEYKQQLLAALQAEVRPMRGQNALQLAAI